MIKFLFYIDDALYLLYNIMLYKDQDFFVSLNPTMHFILVAIEDEL